MCDRAYFSRSEACGTRCGPVLARRFQHETGRGLPCSVLGGGPQMAVGVQGGGRSGMAQGALDGDDIASCCNQSGGKVVPKVMEPDPADTGLLERPTPAVANRVLMWRIVPIAGMPFT